MSIFDRFFKTEEDDAPDKESLAAHGEALVFSRSAYYSRLLHWLESEAMRPVRIDEGRDMLVSAVRQNALLEVRKHILSDVSMAEQATKRIDG